MWVTNGKVAWQIPEESQKYLGLGPLPWDKTGNWKVIDEYPKHEIRIIDNVV